MPHVTTSIRTLATVAAAIGFACIATADAAGPTTTTRPATSRPASRPTTRPMLAPLTPANSIEVKSEKFGLRFRVFKAWQKRDATATEGGEVFVYAPPFVPPAVGSPPSADRHVTVLLGNRADDGMTIDDLAARMRDKVAAHEGHAVKFTRDASAGDVAGEPAWRLDYPSQQKVHVSTRINGVGSSDRDLTLNASERLIFWIHDGMIGQLEYSCDAATAAGMDRNVQQILNSMSYGE